MQLTEEGDKWKTIKKIAFVLFALLTLVFTSVASENTKDNYNKLLDSVVAPINSSIMIKEQVYGVIMYDLEEDVKEEILIEKIDRSMVTEEMKLVLNCESRNQHYNPDGTIKRGSHGEWGIAQFRIGTWDWFSNLSGIYGDIKSEQDQLILMRWSFDHGFQSHWSCWWSEVYNKKP